MSKHQEPVHSPGPPPNMFDWPGTASPGPASVNSAFDPQAPRTAIAPSAASPFRPDTSSIVPAGAPTKKGRTNIVLVGASLTLLAMGAIAAPVVIHLRSGASAARSNDASTLTPDQLAAAPYCGVAATPDMTSDTRAYAAAVIASNQSLTTGGAAAASQGALADLSIQDYVIASDRDFVASVAAISWSSPIRAAEAQAVEDAVHNYDAALSAQTLAQGTTPSDDSDVKAALTQRLAKDQELRQMLGLPATTCATALPS